MRRHTFLSLVLSAAGLLSILACGAAERPAVDEATLRAQLRAEIEDEQAKARRRAALAAVDEQLTGVTRYRVDTTDAPARGASEPLVTIVTFSNFQCPFCGRSQAILRQVLETYPDVQLVFRNNPLPFHQNARPAAEAAAEAYAQGGDAMFWRYHDLLFENQTQLERADLERYAQGIGMDRFALGRALDTHTHVARVEDDIAAATQIGARGTPSFFINGVQLMGAQPFEQFAAIIDRELATARLLLEAETPRAGLYARVQRDARTQPAEVPEAEAGAMVPARPQPDPDAVYRVPIDGRPQLGSDDALVTVVMYVDLQCPFSARVQSTVAELRRSYGADLRVVVRHNPLPFHQRAMPAAEAASEVFAQRGAQAFFSFIERVFENQRELTDANLQAFAEQVGVSGASVAQAIASGRHRSSIEADQALARSLGASGTPAFFINGRNLRGAQPAAVFTTLIDDELARARAAVAGGAAPRDIYPAIVARGATEQQLIEGEPTRVAPQPSHVYPIAVPRSAPSLGPADAPVTIQWFADLQCPFSSRSAATVLQIVQRYPSQVRIVWRDHPLAFHSEAMPAHRVGREIFARVGSDAFWGYVDFIFENQRSLNEALVLQAAGRSGGDLTRVRAVLAGDQYRPEVEADMAAVTDAGARIGTPSFFINGRLLQGAQPIEAFALAINTALREAGLPAPPAPAP